MKVKASEEITKKLLAEFKELCKKYEVYPMVEINLRDGRGEYVFYDKNKLSSQDF